MKRTYTRPSVSPTGKPWGIDCSILAWMDRNAMAWGQARGVWIALGDMLDLLNEAGTLEFMGADGAWRS